jgi:hypothetical protein
VVSGQAIINVGSPSNGILVEWIVERPLDPSYGGPFNLQTTTILDGFSAPPAGTFGPTSGIAKLSAGTSKPATRGRPKTSQRIGMKRGGFGLVDL